MKVHLNIAVLLEYMRERSLPVTVTEIAAAHVMGTNDAYHALQYGVRNGVIERIEASESSLKDRVQYRWTGQTLRCGKKGEGGPSFDALLAAWGIARVPPCLPSFTSPRRVLIE
jgi:hypothetical protein